MLIMVLTVIAIVAAAIVSLGAWVVARMVRDRNVTAGVRCGLIFCGGYLGIACILIAVSFRDDELWQLVFRMLAGAPFVWLGVRVGLKNQTFVEFLMNNTVVCVALSAALVFFVGWIVGSLYRLMALARGRGSEV